MKAPGKIAAICNPSKRPLSAGAKRAVTDKDDTMNNDRTRNERLRRTGDSRQDAEAMFKKATAKPVEGPAKAAPSLPGVKEMVSLRIDKDVLEHFQENGPGWQERINEALRKAAGK
jgi:uncharacterized protein (DUF4415 family)